MADLDTIELVGQNDDMTTQKEMAQLKAEREAAQAKWDEMTPEQMTAVRKAMLHKRLAELHTVERVGQNDDIGRYLTY